MTPLFAARNVEKSFTEGGQRVAVLRGVSLEIRRGEIVALEGPSGSGKTTILSILGCLLTPSAGELWIDGQAVDARHPDQLPEFRRRYIGFVFQQFNLFGALTARENVEYALNLKGQGGRAARIESQRLLEAVGLGDRLDFHPAKLSGGQKQRVAIARALAGGSHALLADEPTGHLDSQSASQVRSLFRQLAKAENRCLLIATHDPAVRGIADRVIGLRDGQIVPLSS